MLDARFAGRLGSFSLDMAFQIAMRGITALFGRSGCGKTTVLRCVAGLTRLPGRLTVDGAVWQDDASAVFRPPHRRPVGYVFQEPSLFRHLSVRDNLLYGHRRSRDPRGRHDAPAFDDVVELLGIAPLLRRGVTALSGGERQRVAIGRALLSYPRLLLMDEPLSALDHITKTELLPYLERLHDALALPILYVSHDVGEVARLADRMIVLADGRVSAHGPVAEMLERLEIGGVDNGVDRFEAGTLLIARIADHDPAYGLTRLDHHGQTITVPWIDRPIGAALRLRIRARDVALAVEAPRGLSIRNVLAGTLATLAAEPDTPFVHAVIDIGAGRVGARITREAADVLALKPGMPLFALIKSVALDER